MKRLCQGTFFVALTIKAFDETLKAVVKFLVTCLVSEILKDKIMTRRGFRLCSLSAFVFGSLSAYVYYYISSI